MLPKGTLFHPLPVVAGGEAFVQGVCLPHHAIYAASSLLILTLDLRILHKSCAGLREAFFLSCPATYKYTTGSWLRPKQTKQQQQQQQSWADLQFLPIALGLWASSHSSAL